MEQPTGDYAVKNHETADDHKTLGLRKADWLRYTQVWIKYLKSTNGQSD